MAHIVQELLPFLQPFFGGGGVVVSKCDDADHSENSAVSRVVFVVPVIDAERWRDGG